jgi:transposase
MSETLPPTLLVPDGFTVLAVAEANGMVSIAVRSRDRVCRCPGCGVASGRIHANYVRRAMDLPVGGRPVRLEVHARKFACDVPTCGRRIFTERFPPGVLDPWARRTGRVEDIVQHFGLALGGRPGARMGARLMMPVAKDTLLRALRRRRCPPPLPPTVIGIDDRAWRRNQRYGTLICDLERRRTIALLPDREVATSRAWLNGQTQIAVVARDRSGLYAQAIGLALPHAMQVADRWHLLENASQAFGDALRRCMRQIRDVIGAATVDPALLTAAERLQYEGYLRREETNGAVMALAEQGIGIKEIVRRTGHSRKLVRRIVRGERGDVFRVRLSSLEVHLPWLDAQWAAGVRNATELHRRLRALGFEGSLRVVGEWATRRRRADQAANGLARRIPASRTIARLLTIGRDTLSKAETVMVVAIEAGVPRLVEAREVIAAFQSMVRRKALPGLDDWIQRARHSLVSSFASGVSKDRFAVAAAILTPWSNGQTEGQITKLKLVKRQMFGRGKIDLLQARVIAYA